MNRIPIGCVVMAAGDARRFGEDKLAAVFDGRTLLERAMDAVPAERLAAVCVVSNRPEAEAMAERRGFRFVRNPHSEWGVSHTIRLGVEALRETCRAIVFLPADQPLLRRESVAALVELARAHPDRVAALAHKGVRGSPCVFPERFFPELCTLTGDTGGSAVIRRHPEALLLLEADARELRDADTPRELAALRAECAGLAAPPPEGTGGNRPA